MSRTLVPVLLLCLVGCAPEAPPTDPPRLADVRGRLVGGEPLHLLPGKHWETTEGGGWRNPGTVWLQLFVSEPTDEDVTLRLEPAGRTRDYHFLAYLDGEALWESSRRLGTGGTVEIPAERLTPGRHTVALERDFERDRQESGAASEVGRENRFETVAYAHASTEVRLLPERAERYELLADFLSWGATGPEHWQYGGLLFDGPGEQELSMEPGTAASFRATAFNLSHDPARFVIVTESGVTESEIGPRGAASLALSVPAGTRRIRARVEGAEEGLFLLGVPRFVEEGDSRRPPVVVVTLDTTRRDVVAPYSGESDVTPNLASFAARSTVFDAAYSTTSWTLPAHGSIFTGLYPSEHGGGVVSEDLSPDSRTLAEILRESGYFTVGLAGGYLCHHRFGLGQGFDLFRDPDGFETRGGDLNAQVQRALDVAPGGPLFLFVNYFDPHAVYDAPEEVEAALGVPELASDLPEGPMWKALREGEVGPWSKIVKGEVEAPDSVVEFLRRAYLAEVAYTDRQLGRLFEMLEERGLFEPALVVVTSDHGELIGESGRFGHAHRLDPELVAVPLLVKWPGQSEGARVDSLVSLVDLFPTALRAARLEIPEQRGLLLTPEGNRMLERRSHIFMEEHERRFHPLFDSLRVARDLYGVQERSRRTVLWEDEEECAELSHSGWRETECPVDEERWTVAMAERILGSPEPVRGPGEALSAEEEENLRALGYL